MPPVEGRSVASKNLVPRTVQYWRLVDGRDGKRVTEVDWDKVLRGLYGTRHTFDIDGREHAGSVQALNVVAAWSPTLDNSAVKDGIAPADPATTYGVVIAAVKDYVPNQENTASGAQKPMSLDGKGWEPVDNLFIWFLPFGNFFGVLAESTSSSRAVKFAEWLTCATKDQYKDDPGFIWDAMPVIDPTRAALLQSAAGLKAAVFAGEIGTNAHEASGAAKLFTGPSTAPTAIRIEIKASLVRGKSSVADQQRILDWFNQNFGSLQGDVEKAQVSIAAHGDVPATEVDLLHHRLTRKTLVHIATGASRAFTASSAVGAIIEAFTVDRADLLRLRNDGN